MKKTLLILTLALVLGLTFYAVESKAHMVPGYGMGMMGGGYGGWGCPMMGPGYGAGYGYNPQYGPGYGPQYGYNPQYGRQYQQPQKQLAENDARTIVENYLRSTRNPNLKLGDIRDVGNAFEADVVTQNNSLVDKILVDKSTGWARSEY